jgi:hypothetical protein
MSDIPCGSETDRAIGTGLGGRVEIGVGRGWVLAPSLSGSLAEYCVSRVGKGKGGNGIRNRGRGVEVDEVDLLMIGNWRECAVVGVGG